MYANQVSVRSLRRAALAAGVSLLSALAMRSEAAPAFTPHLVNSSTIPANGDLNPYGVAFVPEGFSGGGAIAAGDVLVSNFNNSSNVQGTGTTIIRFTPSGALAPSVPAGSTPGNATTFFSSKLQGLSTALGVLRGGFVLVGNFPTTDGTLGTFTGTPPGTLPVALQVIDRNGNLLHAWIDSTFLDSPWDLAVDDHGEVAHVFVSNVVSGTVSRLDVAVSSMDVKVLKKTTIATGYTSQQNNAAVILGPTGLAYDEETDTLYVASTADNEIFAVANAAHASGSVVQGAVAFADPHLRGPLALRLAPNGNLVTANGDAVNGDPLHPSEIVEFTKAGRFVQEYNVDSGQGGAFGLDTARGEDAPFNYAAIDDNTNSLSVYHLPSD